MDNGNHRSASSLTKLELQMNSLDLVKIAEDCGIKGAPLTLTWTALHRFADAVEEFVKNGNAQTKESSTASNNEVV